MATSQARRNSTEASAVDGPTSATPGLELRHVDVRYNRVAVALHGVSLTVPPGSIVAILGANGAGKTTTLRAISGFLPGDNAEVSAGSITDDGVTLVGRKPYSTARRGIVLVPERDKIFTTLTVEENLRSVAPPKGRGDHAATRALIEDLFPVLFERSRQLAGYLSGGERQMLAIAMALTLEPKILLADELSVGVAPVLVERVLAAVRRINEVLGTSVLLVEQNAVSVLAIADYAYVLETGRVVFEGTPAELSEHGDVKDFYLGTSGAGYADGDGDRRSGRWQ